MPPSAAHSPSPLLGSHLSVAGGMHLAITEALSLKLDCLQVFTKNQQQWKAPPLATEAVTAWRTAVAAAGWNSLTSPRLVSHASYLINLASPNQELWDKSLDLMTEEVTRCDALGIPLLVSHPGSSTGTPKPEGITRIAQAYRELFKRTAGCRIISCLEATVGAGSMIGGTFEELATLRQQILDLTGQPDRVGFCIDTCHIHAAGYALDSAASTAAIITQMDAAFGLANIRCLHLNDSLAPAASRKDRHAHITLGTISRDAWAVILRHPLLGTLPAILETPKGDAPSGTPFDAINTELLRALTAGRDPTLTHAASAAPAPASAAAPTTKSRTQPSRKPAAAAASKPHSKPATKAAPAKANTTTKSSTTAKPKAKAPAKAAKKALTQSATKAAAGRAGRPAK
jgi:deoxyribonuclease IV